MLKSEKCEHLMAQENVLYLVSWWNFSSLFSQILNCIAAPLPTMWQDILRHML